MLLNSSLTIIKYCRLSKCVVKYGGSVSKCMVKYGTALEVWQGILQPWVESGTCGVEY